MKQIVIVKPGTVSSQDKKKLERSGHIVIEHPFPGDVRIVSDTAGLTGDDVFMSLLYGVEKSSKSAFFEEFYKRVYKAK